MRIARALGWRGLAAGVIAVACAAPARADEPERVEAPSGNVGGNVGGEAGDGAKPERPPRPPLPPEPAPARLPWETHIEIGGDLALVQRTGSLDAYGNATQVRYRPAIGYGLHARWEIFRYLQVSAYFVGAEHELQFFPRALEQTGSITTDPVKSLAFGARLAPTLRLGTRVRLSPSIGAGYEHLDFARMQVEERGGGRFWVHRRSASFVEIPIGLGVSIDLIRRWLTLDLVTSGAFVLGDGGDATRPAQAVDAQGHLRSIGGLPRIEGSFVQTIGLSIAL